MITFRAFRSYWTLVGSLAVLTTVTGVYFVQNMMNIDWGDDITDPDSHASEDDNKSSDLAED